MSAQPIPFKVPRKSAAEIRSLARVEHARETAVKRAIDRADQVLSRLEASASDFDAEIKKLQTRKKLALARQQKVEDRVLQLMSDAGLRNWWAIESRSRSAAMRSR